MKNAAPDKLVICGTCKGVGSLENIYPPRKPIPCPYCHATGRMYKAKSNVPPIIL